MSLRVLVSVTQTIRRVWSIQSPQLQIRTSSSMTSNLYAVLSRRIEFSSELTTLDTSEVMDTEFANSPREAAIIGKTMFKVREEHTCLRSSQGPTCSHSPTDHLWTEDGWVLTSWNLLC